MRGVRGVLLVALLASPAILAGVDKETKALHRQAMAMVKEAKSLEKSGRLVEARKEYVKSQAVFDTKDAAKGIERIDHELQKQVKEALAESQRLYAGGQFREAAARLEKAQALETWPSLIDRDLALCYYHQGENAKALEFLDRSISATPDPKQRGQLPQLRTILITHETPSELDKNERQRLDDFNLAISKLGFDTTLDDPSSDEGAAGDDPPPASATAPLAKGRRVSSPCLTLESLKSELDRSASAAFDLANCAETNERPQEAAGFLQRYLDLAPRALDHDEVQTRLAELKQLLALSGEHGSEVSRLYGSSFRSIQERKYDRAAGDLEKADGLAPDLALTKWKLALLFEAEGNVEQARSNFTRYQQLDPQNGQNPAQLHLTSLDARRAKYDEKVGKARDILASLLVQGLNLHFNVPKKFRPERAESNSKKGGKKAEKKVGGFAVPFGYAQDQLGQAAQHLQEALALFPLGAEANELMAFIYLQANDGQSAMRCYDAVASQGLPVGFYLECRGHKLDRAARCELSPSGARLIYLSSYDKRGRAAPPAYPAGKDGLGDLILKPSDKRQDQFDALTLSNADIQYVETKNGLVRVRMAKQELELSPLFLPAETPVEGPPARRFANTYTRLFMRYPGLEASKLGKEGLTGFEKVKLGANIMQTAMNVTMSAMVPGAGAFAALEALQDLQEVNSTLRDVNRAVASTHLHFAGWEKLASDQQRMLVGDPFKPIPTESPDLSFAVK